MMEKRTIKIEGLWGITEVDATVYGQLAVHKSAPIEPDEFYAVTHIRTGRLAASYYVEHVAHNFAKELDALLWDDLQKIVQASFDGDVECLSFAKWIKERRQHKAYRDITRHHFNRNSYTLNG